MDLVLARELRERHAAADRVPAGCGAARTLTTPALEAFEVLHEAEGLPSYLLPFELERIYAGLGFPPQVLYSNFVSSIDGVVTLGRGTSAGSVISGKSPADRFLMGLLRACADAVLVGAGTLRATPGHLWTPAHIYPHLAESFTGLRRSLGRTPEPALVLLTALGDIDVSHPAVRRGATVLTTPSGAQALAGRLPETCEVVAMGEEQIDLAQAVDELRNRGLAVILTEGGPHVMGQLIERRLLDEAFLTVSPVLAGRGTQQRFGMVEGAELLPTTAVWSRLLSARRNEDYLFLRYSLRS